MIGLKRGTVELATHDPSWKEEFLKEKEAILSAVSVSIIRIDHVGSTAIPGIKAKPIIDIAMEVECESTVESIAKSLADHGYTYFGDRENRGDYFLAKGPDSKRTHYLHISTKSSSRYDEVVYFRDRLREDRQLAREYEKVKESLFLEFRERRNEYTKRKESFIEKVMKEFSNQSIEEQPIQPPRD